MFTQVRSKEFDSARFKDRIGAYELTTGAGFLEDDIEAEVLPLGYWIFVGRDFGAIGIAKEVAIEGNWPRSRSQ